MLHGDLEVFCSRQNWIFNKEVKMFRGFLRLAKMEMLHGDLEV
jgi:hypothetical protein